MTRLGHLVRLDLCRKIAYARPESIGGIASETSRVHHAFRRRGSYVAALGPGAAIGQDEADRFRFAFARSQRNEPERPTPLPRFFRRA